MVVFGFIANRMNVGTTGLEAGSGTHYFPKWSELAVTLSIVASGFAIFRWVASYFPIFEAHAEGHAEFPLPAGDLGSVPGQSCDGNGTGGAARAHARAGARQPADERAIPVP